MNNKKSIFSHFFNLKNIKVIITMFRYKERMLKECREEKKKNTNKDRVVEKVNEKDQYRFELKGIQQELIKKGIKVHKNDLRYIRHISYDELNEEEKEEIIGNTTIGNLLLALNMNEYGKYSFGGDKRAIAKTHDMTRWQDKKKQTLDKKRGREHKMQSQEFIE